MTLPYCSTNREVIEINVTAEQFYYDIDIALCNGKKVVVNFPDDPELATIHHFNITHSNPDPDGVEEPVYFSLYLIPRRSEVTYIIDSDRYMAPGAFQSNGFSARRPITLSDLESRQLTFNSYLCVTEVQSYRDARKPGLNLQLYIGGYSEQMYWLAGYLGLEEDVEDDE